MKSRKLPITVFLVCMLVFVMSVLLFPQELPAKIATHFNSAGQADGWMTKNGHVMFILMFGFGISALIIGVCYSVRFFPSSMLNVSSRDYWRSKEHYPEACDFIFRHSFWMASMVVLLLISVNYSIVQANRLNPPSLDFKGSFVFIVLFFLGTAVWGISLIFYFLKKGNS